MHVPSRTNPLSSESMQGTSKKYVCHSLLLLALTIAVLGGSGAEFGGDEREADHCRPQTDTSHAASTAHSPCMHAFLMHVC